MDELVMNEIRIEDITDDVSALLAAPLYDIDSGNTVNTTIFAAALADTNAFAVSKYSPENVINTLVPSGEYVLTAPALEGKQTEEARILVNITLKVF